MNPENSAPTALPPARRAPFGRPFPPGISGNPGGRPRMRQDIRDAISDEDGAAVAAELVRLALHAKHESVRRAACENVLDRLHGRPAQAIVAAVAELPSADLDALLRAQLSARLAALAASPEVEVEAHRLPESGRGQTGAPASVDGRLTGERADS